MSESEAPTPEPVPEPVSEPEPEPVSRPEDQIVAEREKGFAPLSAPEVPLEESRKDETSSLATDKYDQEGNRVQ